jgi:hypothetical protein
VDEKASLLRATLPNGLVCFASTEHSRELAVVTCALNSLGTLLWIVDYAALGTRPPIGGRPLFNWLPSGPARRFSPTVVLAEGIGGDAMPGDGWHRHAVVGILTSLNVEPFLRHLRHVVRGQHQSTTPADAAWMVIPWSVPRLREMVTTAPDRLIRFMLTGIDAAILPGDGPESWEVYGRQSLEPLLR